MGSLVPVPLVPVEYAVAVEHYLGRAALGPGSRRVYQISLASWAWPLAGKPVPAGPRRRGAAPPVLPLALLDDPATAGLVAAGLAARAASAGARTANRELSALRGAPGWWREQGWITGDPAAGLSHRHLGRPAPPLSGEQVAAVFRLPVSLREHALWRLLHDSGAPATSVLGLDADQLDLARNRVRARDELAVAGAIQWRAETSHLVRWLLAGRMQGPVFLTGQRAPAGTAPADTCRATGQGRLSYRRAAELFTGLTRPLDDAGRGWTLHQLGAGGGQPARPA